MSPKTIRYTLIAGVLFIWSIIIYRVIVGVSDSPGKIVQQTVVHASEVNFKEEEFYLYADYPDPFIPAEESDTLESASPQAISSPDAGNLSTSAAPSQPIKPDLSFIQYHGMIANQDKKRKVALVSFRGVNFLIKEKDKKEGVLFKKIETDKLTIIINGKSFIIDKS